MSATRSIGMRALAAFAACAGLAACGSSEKEPRPVCPRAAVLSDAAALTRFAAGPGRDPLDIDVKIEIEDLSSGCQFEKRDGGSQNLVVALAPTIVATRGPANTTHRAGFAYFVSVVGSDRAILSKEEFPIEVTFEGNQRRRELREDDPPITVDIPLSQSGDATNYEILVGLQLSAAELEYNRRHALQPR